MVELGLGLGHGVLEHAFPIDGFLVLQVDPLADVALEGVELAFQLRELNAGLLVLGMVGAVLGFHDGELLAGFIDAVGEPAKLFSLSGRLGGFQGTALHRIIGGLFAHAIGLGGGELGVELEQARGENAGLLLRVDDAQVPFKPRQGGGGKLHFGPELFDLLLHEGGESGSGAETDVIGVLDVAVGRCHWRRRRRVPDSGER